MVEKSDERLLPTNKVRTIMKSCGDPSAFLSKESVLVVTKAAVRISKRIIVRHYWLTLFSFMNVRNCLFHI